MNAPVRRAATSSGSLGARVGAIVQLTMARTVRPVPIAIGLVIAALPMVFALVFRSVATGDDAELAQFLLARYDNFVVTLLLPLAALLSAAGATSAEREDGTMLYLLTTTTSRATIVLTRWLLATVLTSALVSVSVAGTAMIAGQGSDPTGVMRSFLIGIVAGAAVYSALFLCFALWLRRSLLVGLLYVLVWEGTIAGNLPALRFLSARRVLLGITQRFVEEPERGASLFSGVPGATASVGWAVAVTVLALGLAIYRLQRLPLARPR